MDEVRKAGRGQMYSLEGQNLTLLKQAKTRGTPSLGPSTPGMKSILGPIQLKGLTMENLRPFSAPSAMQKKKRIKLEVNMNLLDSSISRNIFLQQQVL